MKINKFTIALLGLGVLSLASVAEASNPVVYLAGASALRSTLFTAATTPGVIFDSGHAGTVVSSAPNNTSTSTYIVFEGPINGTTVDIDAFWTGAEAGVADVAGKIITQTLSNSALGANGVGTYNIPGIPAKFLNPNNGWTTTNTLATIAGAPAVADLALDDTSQAVSLTSHAAYPLVDYGAIAVVPFTFQKGYEATPDQAWNDFVNVTTAEINQIYASPQPASFVTGVSADSSDSVAITGRNLSSGTRVNALLTSQLPYTFQVDQWAYQPVYATAGTLTAGTGYASPGALTEIFNDGFNSSGVAAAQLNFDGTGSGVVLVEPLAVPDAAGAAHTAIPAGGGAASYLSYNGVYESDSAVENGNYTFWGQEHIFGTVGQLSSSTAGQVGIAISRGGGSGHALGLPQYLINSGAGTATGAVGPTYTAQSALIPESLLQVSKGSDGAFPTPL